MFSYLKHLQAINPSFVTINKTEEISCEGVKCICTFFEIERKQDFLLPRSYLKLQFIRNSLNILF